MTSLKYRPDIDGLRAIAVLSVMFFHFNSNYLSGGFLGVDVFFVISGYLITSIIYKEQATNSFTFQSFYVRRMKRILPPLFLMLTLTLFVGCLIMLPYDFFKLAVSVASVLIFSSNYQYAIRTEDYFASNSSEWPLLHTWSLAVEEQYYFIFPVLLFFIIRNFKNSTLLLLTTIAVLSFGLAEWMSRSGQFTALSYYFIFSRMGELLTGSLLAIAHFHGYIRKTESSLLACTSLALVLFLFIHIDKSQPFPGFIALVLCMPIVVLLNSQNTIVNRLLSLKPIVYIGLLSYSLYLFHWPILAFFRYLFNVNGSESVLTLNNQAMALIMIVVTSMISYYVVEKPAREFKTSKARVFIGYFIVPSLVIGLFSSFVIFQKGWPQRLSSDHLDASLQFSHIDRNICPSLINLNCQGGSKESEKHIVFFGNSHAEHYFEFVSLIAKSKGYSVSLFSSGGCLISTESQKCRTAYEAYSAYAESRDITLIAFRWDTITESEIELNALRNILLEAKKISGRVIVLAQPPMLAFEPDKVYNCSRLKIPCEMTKSFIDDNSHNELIKKIALDAGVEFYDPFQNINRSELLSKDNKVHYYDSNHLSVYGARWLFEQYQSNAVNSVFQM
ncbi:acyltransferase family protein [Pseudoalteromonas xiamenensis]